MATKIEDAAPVVRHVNIEGYDYLVTMSAEGIKFERKGDRTRGEKPSVTLAWTDATELAAERRKDSEGNPAPVSIYTHLGFDK